jgi:uncharacterized protein
MPAHYDLKKSDGQFMFNLKAGNNETILTSERYKERASAVKGIDSVRVNAALEQRYERKTAKNGQNFFVLKAANHEVIGTSEEYSSAGAMETGIASVKQNAPGAPVTDLT